MFFSRPRCDRKTKRAAEGQSGRQRYGKVIFCFVVFYSFLFSFICSGKRTGVLTHRKEGMEDKRIGSFVRKKKNKRGGQGNEAEIA